MIFFRVGLEKVITLPPPSIPDLEEVEEVKRIVAVRTPDQVESIMNHDEVPFYAIRKVCENNGLVFHKNEFNQIIEESAIIIRKFKDHFDRDRPVEVFPQLNTLPSKTNKTRSYPSGHATQSVLVAKYVAGKVPRLEKDLMAAAYECGYGRVIAGFHYPSDFEVGNLLGEKMYVFMNKADYADETENE
jgi:acid phosphatase (class A)